MFTQKFVKDFHRRTKARPSIAGVPPRPLLRLQNPGCRKPEASTVIVREGRSDRERDAVGTPAEAGQTAPSEGPLDPGAGPRMPRRREKTVGERESGWRSRPCRNEEGGYGWRVCAGAIGPHQRHGVPGARIRPFDLRRSGHGGNPVERTRRTACRQGTAGFLPSAAPAAAARRRKRSTSPIGTDSTTA